MGNKLLNAIAGEKLLLSGNESIVRGALEAGVAVATSYPGTPASEIGDNFSAIADEAGIHFEHSINEKVAFEVAYGAAIAGVRAITSMKHLGLNVAADPFVTSAYTGIEGGLVIVSAAEPGCHTSPNEQDQRYLAKMAYIPVLDPSDPQEALDMARISFEISEKWKLPVLLRPTTRVSHSQSIVTVGEICKKKKLAEFKKGQSRLTPLPAIARELRKWLIERFEMASTDPICRIFNKIEGKGNELAIITSGVSYLYTLDAVKKLNVKDNVKIVKIGIPLPVDKKFISEAVFSSQKIIVIEELEPFIEDYVKTILFESGLYIPVYGKSDGLIPIAGELSPSIIQRAIEKILLNKTRQKFKKDVSSIRETAENEIIQSTAELPLRPPVLCPGCPHRSSFFMVKLVAGKDDVFVNDIGCYTLGKNKPFEMADMLLAMGTSISGGGGMSLVSKNKIVAFIGDSTFFHSGITGLANAVINNHNLLVVILDNCVTAMTGHQPSPSFTSSKSPSLSIEEMVRACGVRNIAVVDPENVAQVNKTIRQFYSLKGVSVIISRHPCPLFKKASETTERNKRNVFSVKTEKCSVCGVGKIRFAACKEKPYPEFSFARTRRKIMSGINTRLLSEHAWCVNECPAGVCIPGFINHMQAGNIESAYRTIRQALPLANVLSRICPRPCEKRCVMAKAGEPVAINDLKRFVLESVSESAKKEFLKQIADSINENNIKIAIIGSGPAGLSAAWEMRMRGYEVTVFEKEKEPGGLLRWGIPRFRLPLDVVTKDIEEILSMGIKLETEKTIGINPGITDLFEYGFSSIFVAAGAGNGAVPDIEGTDLPSVMNVIEFMKGVEQKNIRSTKGRVVVVGGGDAAIDSARTSIRLGANEVIILYRRTRKEMPASTEEAKIAEAEGVKFMFQAVPVAIKKGEINELKITAARTKPTGCLSNGRMEFVIEKGDEFEISANLVIFATGQKPDDVIINLFKRKQDMARDFSSIDKITFETKLSNIFAGGDIVTGPATVVEAVAAGRKAAWNIDKKLRGDKAIEIYAGLNKKELRNSDILLPENFKPEKRLELISLFTTNQKNNKNGDKISNIELFYKEAERCLGCGSCYLCESCITSFGCSAFARSETDGKPEINPILCNGCGVCTFVCPNNAIEETTEKTLTAKTIEMDTIITSKCKPSSIQSKTTLKLHLAGVGGQGTLTVSRIIGETAMRAGKNVIISALHGMAQRGGMVSNQIIIGDAKSPIIEHGEADIISGFEPVETLRSLDFANHESIVFMNIQPIIPFSLTLTGGCYPSTSNILKLINGKTPFISVINATKIATVSGNPQAVGTVMLGFMAGTDIFPFPADLLRKTIAEFYSGDTKDTNLKAFDRGFEEAKKLNAS